MVDDRGDEGRAAPSHAELERAIASVPGVVDAVVATGEGAARSRLRIRLAPQEDAEAVAWAVAATLRERFGIALDPDDIRPRTVAEEVTGPAAAPSEALAAAPSEALGAAPSEALAAGTPEPGPVAEDDVPEHGDPEHGDLLEVRERLSRAAREAAAGSGGRRSGPDPLDILWGRQPDDEGAAGATVPAGAEGTSPTAERAASAGSHPRRSRAVIRTLDTQLDRHDVRVTATLEHGGRAGQGEALSVATGHGVLRAVAEATVAALRSLSSERLTAGIDRIVLDPAHDPATALVVLTLVSERGEERLVGSSIVRGDPERAVMRATLDALNRRVASYLLDEVAAGA